jgi:hypothetical protein
MGRRAGSAKKILEVNQDATVDRAVHDVTLTGGDADGENAGSEA